MHAALVPLLLLVLEAMEDLAEVLEERGSLRAARELLERVLEVRMKNDGPNAYATGGTAMSLGLLLLHQGKYAEAEPVLERSLAIKERALGQDHPEVAGAAGGMKSAGLRTRGRHRGTSSRPGRRIGGRRGVSVGEISVVPRGRHGSTPASPFPRPASGRKAWA